MSAHRFTRTRILLLLLSPTMILLTWRPVDAGDQIRWRSGPVDTTAKNPREIGEAFAELAARSNARHVIVQFAGPVGPDQRAQLQTAGLQLLSYLSDDAFFATVSTEGLDLSAAPQLPSLIDVQPIRRAWKLHADLAANAPPPWSVVDANDGNPIIGAYVLFHRDVPLTPDAIAVARRHGAVVRPPLRTINALVVELPLDGISALADEDAVQWIEPPLPPLEEINDLTRQITEAEIVQAPPYDLDGSGVTVLVFDAGAALESHADFGGRLHARDSDDVSNHSTHVACTVGGDGTASDGQYRGMTPAVALESYEADCCPSGFLYSDPIDIEADYDEAINVYGVHLATNSIGTNVCANGFDCEWTGDYGATAQLIDSIVYGSLGDPFRVVWANGNERGCDRCRIEGVHTPEGYHSTAPPACAKNHITVGALEDDETVTSFTSWGPTDDGRLKPDVSAPGRTVVSCSASGGYTSMSGTSMAAPAVAGVSSLLMQDFRDHFPLRDDPRNSTVKVLFAHTALDLENPGPDFQTGYGSVKIQQAIDFMRSDNGLNFIEAEVLQGQAFGLAVRVNPGDSQLKVTLAWDDYPGTPNVDPALVNDLDLRVYDPDAAQHLPWTLDPLDPGAPAVQTQPDRINNIEQVFVDSPMEGLWLVEVFGYDVPEGPQPFSLCASPRLVYDCNENGIPDDEEIQGDPSLDCSGNGILDECEPDCDSDGTADSCEIFQGTSTDCQLNGIPDDCEDFADCNDNGVYDPCDISDGSSYDCNANWIPDECGDEAEDCNNNTVPDLCDVNDGTSEDCNHNYVPDECEPHEDCNENGTMDICDIGDGTSEDCNANSIPDECESHGTVFVDDDAPGDPAPGDPTVSDPDEDGSPAHPYDSIQEAIDTTGCGELITDTVELADGIYTGPGNRDLDFNGRVITLRSVSGPESCIIDCEGTGRGFDFHSGEPPTARLDGLTIRNGYADNGAAIKCTDGSSPTVSNCIITNNTAEGIGGGIRCDLGSNPTISSCLIAYNTAVSGGGMYTSGSGFSLVVNCVFLDNYVSGEGGALKSAGYGSPIVANCVFAGNTAGTAGGAVSCLLSDFGPHFTNCTFTGNTSPGRGGAIFSTLGVQVRIDDCTFTGNDSWSEGGAIFIAGNTVATIRNTIMWADVGSNGQEIALGGTHPTVDVAYSNVAGGEAGVYIHDVGTILWGDGNLDVDPLFIDADGEDDLIGTPDDNVRLASESLCTDAGDNASVPEDIADLDGDGNTAEPIPFDLDGGPRLRDNPFMPDTGNGQPPIVDMGPYEFQYDRPIPAVSEWGMVAMTLLLLIVATLLWGRWSPARPRTGRRRCRT